MSPLLLFDNQCVLLSYWNRLRPIPLGRYWASWIFWLYVPYSGSVRPEIRELRQGYARVRIRDRRLSRNHLGSIHAAALMNVAEAASGLSLVAGLPKELRAILVSFQIDYLRKARGPIEAECHSEIPELGREERYELKSILRDKKGTIVAQATATWLVGPVKAKLT